MIVDHIAKLYRMIKKEKRWNERAIRIYQLDSQLTLLASGNLSSSMDTSGFLMKGAYEFR